MIESRLYSVPAKIRELEQKLDEFYWEPKGYDLQEVKLWETQLYHLQELSKQGVTLDAKF